MSDFEKMNKIVEDFFGNKPEVKDGRWNHYTDDIDDFLECSECHYGSEGEVPFGYPAKMGWKYCPCCGAEMFGGEE